MKRGEIVLVALHGDIGKARPALIIQTDSISDTVHTLVCPLTTLVREEVTQRRVSVSPDADNGLKQPSQIMVDKINLVRRDKCRDTIGRLGPESMADVDQALALIVGLSEPV